MSVRIDADIAIDGMGDAVKNASVVYENELITYFGESEHAPEAEKTQKVPAIMPGMWDCHIHLGGLKGFQESSFVNPYVRAARATGDLKRILRSGFTSVRELGGMGVYLNQAVEEESIVGPRIYGSGSILTMTGGHGDMAANSEMPLEVTPYIPGYVGEVVDGPIGGQVGVRKMLRKGAEVIKIACSGGGLSKTNPQHTQFTLEEIQAIVQEAARAERVVAAHAHGAEGIRQAIMAGVKTIEHGSYLDEDLCDLMIEHDVILVPTVTIPHEVLKILPQMPLHTQEKAEHLFTSWIPATKLAITKGVKIAMGTDLYASGHQKLMEFGSNAKELEFYVEYGMKPMDALVAATGHGPLTVGKQAEKTGILKEGYQADLLVLDSNPLEDISILSEKVHIMQVIKRGQLY